MTAGVSANGVASDDSLLVTVEEAARRLSLSRSSVYELLSAGNLLSVKIGASRRRLSRVPWNFGGGPV